MKNGWPLVIWTSTSTRRASTPSNATVTTRATMATHPHLSTGCADSSDQSKNKLRTGSEDTYHYDRNLTDNPENKVNF
jgi:hypothetical protein